MKKRTLILGAVMIGAMCGYTVLGQTATNDLSLGMPEVLLLKSNSTTVNLTLTPQEAGLPVLSSLSNSDARVLVSSVVSGTQTRTMTASISAGTVPAGTYLKIQALTPNTNFVGTAGTMGSEATLVNGGDAQIIITGIGTCYSGTASDDGYGLKYTYGISGSTADYALIRASGGASVTVTLTLSAGA
ncbi:MAG: hypothetical protein Q8914_03625 [Bacteroidota bacterium]|nr:hypothetical protein [Bacteroidota bacterium]